MSDAVPSVVSPRPVATSTFLPAWVRIGLIALLLAEVLYLTVSFDTVTLGRVGSVWTVLAGWSPEYVRLAIVVVFAVSLLGTTGLASLRGFSIATHTPPSRGWLGVHLLSFGAFIWLTRTFFSATATVASQPGVWTLTWLLAGLLMIASWALAAYPQQRWWTTAVENRLVLISSLAAGVGAWAFSFLAETLWTPLARYTFSVVTWLLGFFYTDPVSQPDRLIVGTARFKVAISPECSGYEGIGLVLAFLTIYLFLFRKELRFPAALILLPIGAVAIWLLNLARIVTLIAIGASGWPAIATGGFHSQAGWLAFNAVALGFVVLINRGGYFAVRHVTARAVHGAVETAPDSTTPFLAPLVAILGVAMLTGAVSAGFDWLYGVRIAVALGVFWACRAAYRELDWRCSWHAAAIGTLIAVMWIAAFPAALDNNSSWPAALQSADPLLSGIWILIRLFGYVLVVPIAEELVFRVYAMRRLTRRDMDAVPVGTFTLTSFVVSSLLFGALHGALWLQGTVAGMAFACALYRRRRFGDAVLAHAVTNGAIAAYVFITGRWSVWS
jgi:exosortase E/protease (VPEID-CTERM system)